MSFDKRSGSTGIPFPGPQARSAGRVVRRAGAAAVGLLGLAAGLFFLAPSAGPDLLPQPGVDSAYAEPAPDGAPAIGADARRPQLAALSDAASNEALLAEPYRVTLTVARGDTLMAMLTDAGLDRPQAHRAIQALAEVYSPRKLKPGHAFDLTLAPAVGERPAALQELRFEPDAARRVVVARESAVDGPHFTARAIDRPLTTRLARAGGSIESSLYVAALEAGVPTTVLGDMITIFSFDIDFQREIQPGDRFSLLFEEKRDEEGAFVGSGDVLIAEMTVGGKQRRYYRFEDSDGFVDYFDADGRSVRKALLRTPVDGARISSRFGKRMHPILGYTKMHKGMDFAAPTGTPIYAAGDGVVEVAGWNGGFGKYIRIRHNSTYKTAYAHLSRIDGRVKPGAKVRQRQIIGYVGTTGRSTGPHLHYEVHKAGRAVNPQGVKLPTGKVLAGAELTRFQAAKGAVETLYAQAEPMGGVALAAEDGGSCSAPAVATC